MIFETPHNFWERAGNFFPALSQLRFQCWSAKFGRRDRKFRFWKLTLQLYCKEKCGIKEEEEVRLELVQLKLYYVSRCIILNTYFEKLFLLRLFKQFYGWRIFRGNSRCIARRNTQWKEGKMCSFIILLSIPSLLM